MKRPVSKRWYLPSLGKCNTIVVDAVAKIRKVNHMEIPMSSRNGKTIRVEAVRVLRGEEGWSV